MSLSLRNSAQTEEIDYNFVRQTLHRYKNPRVKIHDLLKKGDIIRVKKGLYVFGPELARKPYSKEVLANLIYGPSYISLHYALSFYGLIPERVETVTNITNKRKKLFNTPIGAFSYRQIKASAYPYGITLYEMDDRRSFLIATKEKALADVLYFSQSISTAQEMETFLTEDLRLEREQLHAFNLQRVKVLAGLYGHSVDLLYTFLGQLR